mmetsp:Transcript_3358/g.6397  ORF Transcript_3358/g.6397 Transcript_3358/m.6397 type:complete len:84 (-) Transcript_3358:1619-1870(-)
MQSRHLASRCSCLQKKSLPTSYAIFKRHHFQVQLHEGFFCVSVETQACLVHFHQMSELCHTTHELCAGRGSPEQALLKMMYQI